MQRAILLLLDDSAKAIKWKNRVECGAATAEWRRFIIIVAKCSNYTRNQCCQLY